ncbi:MAG: sigma 54-interacting transcriptional regulator [Bacillota bacterium]
MAFPENLIEKGTELIKPFSSLSGFDMAIEDKKGLVLSGTGQWIKKVGTHRPEGSYFDLTLKTGKPYACTDPKFSPQCYKCPIRNNCPYSFTASYPIIFNGEVKGLIGYLGYKNSQRDFFLEKQSILMEALEELTSFVSVVYDDASRGRLDYSSKLFEDILNEMHEGIMFLDSRLRVTYVNRAASSMLDSAPGDLVGKRLKTRLPDVEKAFKKLRESNNMNFNNMYNKMTAEIESGSHGTISLHKWDESETRFVIFKNYLTGVRNGVSNAIGGYSKESAVFEGILGDSEAINYTKRLASRLAKTDASVLIVGETGVGKELFAKAIHKNSHRQKMPFVIVNCAAIPEALIESELFGYKSGAFSGANQDGKPGKFEAADGGTLFLDEIGELPMNAQSKLLRAVEQMEIEKVGAVKPIKIDVRIIAATNRDLKSLIKQGKFREDLYYRLNIMPLEIPTLRERREDIPILFTNFLETFDGIQKVLSESFTIEFISVLLSYDWPGNVRELKNICQYLVVNYAGRPFQVEDLPPYLQEVFDRQPGEKKPWDSSPAVNKCEPNSKGSLQSVNEVLIRQALGKYGYTTAGKRRTASSLGISLSTLYRKLNQYNIKDKS